MGGEELPYIEEEPPKTVLAICGGGYAGLFAAEFLARLEKDLTGVLDGNSLGHAFSLISGTSIGGILALGLAKGLAAADLPGLLSDLGPVLFGQPGWGILSPKHDSSPLNKRIEEIFGQDPLSSLPHAVLVPAINLTAGEAIIYGNNKHDSTAERPIIEAAMATSAAPWYLAPHASDHSLYADGGLIANSPEVLAAIEAVHRRGWPRGRVRMLVVGSTRVNVRLTGDLLDANWGLVEWGKSKKLMTTAMCAQMSLARQQSRQILGNENVLEADVELNSKEQELVGLDKANFDAKLVLKTLAKEAYTKFRAENPVILESWFGVSN